MSASERGHNVFSDEEYELRVQLAAGYRLAERFGLSELISTHISLRVPGPEPTFLMNAHGLLFDEITASNLVKVDMQGKVVDPIDGKVNRAGVVIHAGVQRARPDINCVFHAHSPYAIAVSALECGFLSMSQTAMRFHGQIAYHDYGRAATDPAEGDRLAEDMGKSPVVMLRNHGTITTGRTVAEAFIAAFYLEKACQIQVAAQSTGQPLIMPPDDVARDTVRAPGIDEPAWPALLRMLDHQDSSYRD